MVEETVPYSTSNHSSSEWDWDNPDALKWCDVSLSKVIAAGKRLEASVYDPEGMKARKLVEEGKYPAKFLTGEKGIATAYKLGIFKRILVPYSDYPFYQPSSVMDLMPEPDGYLSLKTDFDLESLRCQKGQVLLTRSGTIGNVSYVSDTLDKKMLSDDLIRINCNDETDSGYVYAFLKSEIGKKIIVSSQYGSVISHIEPSHLVSIPIPYPPKKLREKISQMILTSYELRDASNELWKEAINLLNKELHLVDYYKFVNDKKNMHNTYSVKFSDLQGRLDGSYHIPLINSILKHFEKYADEVTTVGDERISSNVILPGRFKRNYVRPGHGRVFIGGKQITELDPSNKKYLSEKEHNSRIEKELVLKENMVLITCSGTIGKIASVPKHWENWSASQHIIRVVPKSKNIAGYLAAYLSTQYAQVFIKRFTYGAVVDEVDGKQISLVPVPLLKNKEVQKSINDKILLANKKRYKAYLLEKKALHIMDEEVLGRL